MTVDKQMPDVCKNCGWKCKPGDRIVAMAWRDGDCRDFMAFGDGVDR